MGKYIDYILEKLKDINTFSKIQLLLYIDENLSLEIGDSDLKIYL